MIAVVVILGLCAISVSSGPIKYDPSRTRIFGFKVYDIADGIRNNSLNYNEVNKQFEENGYYEFKEYDEFRNYQDGPTLFVYRPEDSSELHGYYFSQGVYSIVTSNYDDNTYNNDEQYEPFLGIFIEGAFIGFTPKAVSYRLPDAFSGYKLTKFVHKDEVAPEFAVVFLLPRRLAGSDDEFEGGLHTQTLHFRKGHPKK